jgi:hypothetical protein
VLRFALLFVIASVYAPATGQPVPASLTVAPAAQQLFERDWVLMNWALKFYDRDRDILLQPTEAQAAAAEFRKIADANGDGRVTTEEYRAAREFILARY